MTRRPECKSFLAKAGFEKKETQFKKLGFLFIYRFAHA